jgi:hypothetical protein
VVQGDDWNQLERRLPVYVESSETVIRLFDGNTWARLLHVQGNEPVEERRAFGAPSPKQPLDVRFGSQVRLLGYDLRCKANGGRAPCDVRLYWQAQQRLDTSYTVFAQLLDAAGKVRAQADTVPQGGGYPTIWWLPGEVVVDSLTLQLPAAAPTGEPYRLIVGLYDETTGVRLPVEGTGADFMELTSLRMR